MQSAKNKKEDEIDLRELFNIILKNKKILFLITFIGTMLAIVYVFAATPKYKAQALVEIGSYKVEQLADNGKSKTIEKVYLDNANAIKTMLETLFIDAEKNIKNKRAEVKSITLPKGSRTFIRIKALAVSNKDAKDKIDNIVSYIQNRHKTLLADIKRRRLKEIELLEKEKSVIKTKKIPLNNEKITKTKKELSFYKENKEKLVDEFNKVKNSDSTLALLILTQQKNIQQTISELEERLDNLINSGNELEIEISNINTKIDNKKDLLKPYNYKNTQIVGKILTQDKPVKPKKVLIVIVSFITSFIFAIFAIFFKEFLQAVKEDN
jgi:LPS O-antigen subunit length determinant protein (WzzB/FepE family)